MSDDTKQELDNFGVWVKKPPVDSTGNEEFSDLDSLSIQNDTELGSFEDGDSTLSLSELTAITQSSVITEEGVSPEEGGSVNTDTEDVSLDEFLSDEELADSAVEEPAAPKQTENSEESVDLSEFGLEETASDTPATTETVSTSDSDDQPLDISLSFDDADDSVPSLDSGAASESASSSSDMETVDLSEFGLDDDSSDSTSEPAAAGDANETEDVTAEFADITAPAQEEAAPAADTQGDSNNGSMENVDLSEFGFDDADKAEAEPEPAATTETNAEETAASDDDFTVSLDSDEATEEVAAPAVEAVEPEPTPAPAAQSAPEAAPIAPETVAILNQIVGELRSLKDEITTLKSDFETLKNANAAKASAEPVAAVATTDEEPVNDIAPESEAEPAVTEDTEVEVSAAEAEPSSGGFFGDDDGDETIALSLDEMDNILNTADFADAPTEEAAAEETNAADEDAAPIDTIAEEAAPAEDSVLGNIDDTVPIPEQEYEQESDLKMDFANESIEEPNIGEIAEEPATEEAVPEEIAIPKVDDVIVESEQTDFIEETPADSFDEPELSIADSLTDEKLDYLSKDASLEEFETAPAAQETEEPVLTEETVSEAEVQPEAEPAPAVEEAPAEEEEPSIEPIPVSDDIAPIEMVLPEEEPAAEETTAEPEPEAAPEAPAAEPVVAETAAPEPVPANPITEADNGSVPNDLRQEIKYVLSYMDQLLENLPEEKIAEFAQSEQFETYKKLFKELGLA